MKFDKALMNRVTARKNECIKIAEKHFGRTFPHLAVKYTLRGRTAGRAHLMSGFININSVLLVENVDEMINDTVGHEVAHMIDYWVNGVNFYWKGRRRCQDQHGENWKSIMRLLGQDPSRCHNMDTSNAVVRKSTKHIWQCGCSEHVEMELGPKRHTKMERSPNSAYYIRRHKRCGWTYVGTVNRNGDRTDFNRVNFKDAAQAAKTLTKNAGNLTPPKPKAKRAPKRKGSPSKLDQCRSIFTDHPYLARAGLISLFVNIAGCTKAGAATYYAKIKKENG